MFRPPGTSRCSTRVTATSTRAPLRPEGPTPPGRTRSTSPAGRRRSDVILSSIGYSTVWYPLTVSSSTPVVQNVLAPPLAPGQLGSFQTTLNFAGINLSKGTGNLAVKTVATLGNDTVFPNLPNATVGQLWAQLGLDFSHSASFPSSSLGAVERWVNSTGPFFPADPGPDLGERHRVRRARGSRDALELHLHLHDLVRPLVERDPNLPVVRELRAQRDGPRQREHVLDCVQLRAPDVELGRLQLHPRAAHR